MDVQRQAALKEAFNKTIPKPNFNFNYSLSREVVKRSLS